MRTSTELSPRRRLAAWIPLTFVPGRGAPTRSMLTLGQPLSPFDWPLPGLFRWFSPYGTHLMARLCGVRHLVTRSCRRDCREPMASDLKSRQTTPPYFGVRGTGRAQLLPSDAAVVLPQLIDKYLGDQTVPLAKWLLSRLDEEVAIRIDSLTLSSWDYSRRM